MKTLQELALQVISENVTQLNISILHDDLTSSLANFCLPRQKEVLFQSALAEMKGFKSYISQDQKHTSTFFKPKYTIIYAHENLMFTIEFLVFLHKNNFILSKELEDNLISSQLIQALFACSSASKLIELCGMYEKIAENITKQPKEWFVEKFGGYNSHQLKEMNQIENPPQDSLDRTSGAYYFQLAKSNINIKNFLLYQHKDKFDPKDIEAFENDINKHCRSYGYDFNS